MTSDNGDTGMAQKKIRKELEQLADLEYRDFSSALVPDAAPMIGVRIPQLRHLAADIAGEDWHSYLRTAKDTSFEEIMLQGMVIGYAKCTLEERFAWISLFVPKINNWSVCDSFCAGLKFAVKNQEETWSFLQPYLYSDKEFEERFAVVMLLDHFTDEKWISSAFDAFNRMNRKGYYVRMAIAWAVSKYYIKYPQRTLNYLQNNMLDNETYNKALQKIIESLRVDNETKKMIRSMKH
jgi:3-methyladenine DNA glycosylase AlkD